MKHTLLILFLATALCRGQGTFTVTFDEPPLVPPIVYRQAHEYYEAGMWVRAELPTGYFDLYRGGLQCPTFLTTIRRTW